MITGFALVCLQVLDLDEAKAFYVDTLGFEVGIDQELDGFRWLTVHPPSAPETPANVLTTPVGLILRIVRLPPSATYTVPAASTATPNGLKKRAAAPPPSALPEKPGLPARVVTTPAAVIFRIV